MSGAGLIEMLAARLGGRGMRRSAPALREVLASAMPNRAPVTAYEPIASRIDDPMAEGAMLAGADDMAPPMPNAARTGPDAGPSQTGRAPAIERVRVADIKFPPQENQRRLVGPWREGEAPLLLARESDGSLTAHDGNHRARLAQAEGIESVDAVILPADELNRIYTEGFEGGTIGAQAYRDVVARARRTAPDGGSARNGNVYYRGVRSGDALDGEGPIYLHRDPGKASEFAGARFDSDGRPLVEITGEGGNVARVTADFSNPKEVSNQEMAALGYEPYRIQQFTAQGFDAAISPNGEVLVFNRAAVNPSRTAPNAGSDRNALQRALRDRMNRE